MKLKISELKPNPDNPRLIKDEKYQKLVESLKGFPEMADIREIVVNKDYMILGGNMRYKAMKEAGWKEVSVKVVDLSEDKQKEFIIKDNNPYGEWDWDIVSHDYELEDLENWAVELPYDMKQTDGSDESQEICESCGQRIRKRIDRELSEVKNG